MQKYMLHDKKVKKLLQIYIHTMLSESKLAEENLVHEMGIHPKDFLLP